MCVQSVRIVHRKMSVKNAKPSGEFLWNCRG